MMKTDLGDGIETAAPKNRLGAKPAGSAIGNHCDGGGFGYCLGHGFIKNQTRPENKYNIYMRRLLKVLGKTEIPYYVSGDSPTLLIHSGTHGDESGVIESVRRAVEKYAARLPDFVYVPIVSPSAVARGTRENGDGIDINRSFLENSPLAEVEANFSIVDDRKFDLLVTFHEDLYWETTFYLYDVNCGLGETEAWRRFKAELRLMGADLLTGVDDPDDPTLNLAFVDGYHYFSAPKNGYPGGGFDAWAFRNKVIKGFLNPEIPGKLSQEKKNKVVDLFFRRFLLVA